MTELPGFVLPVIRSPGHTDQHQAVTRDAVDRLLMGITGTGLHVFYDKVVIVPAPKPAPQGIIDQFLAKPAGTRNWITILLVSADALGYLD